MNSDKDEFYIGYLDRAPAGLARRLRVTAIVLALGIAAAAGALAAWQTPAEPGVYEFGVERAWEGVLYEGGLPLLHASSPAGATNYVLVGDGKFGLPSWARGHDGERVRFSGSLIRKGRMTMIEMNNSVSFSAAGPAAASAPPEKRAGRARLSGELVDTKCYFGVMRPAAGKVHRGCAVRCLSGGVPPGLLLRDAAGEGRVVMLEGPGGAPLKFNPEWAARRVVAEGWLKDAEGTLILEADSFLLE